MTRAPNRSAAIELDIDEVVWHGGRETDRRTFVEALERALVHELGNPVVQRALARGGTDIGALDAGRVPRISGDTVARAVSGSLVNAARTRR
jgi:hypothetical protein